VQEVSLQDVFASIEAAFKASDLDRVEMLLWPALDQFPYESRLWFYGGCVYFKRGLCAIAAQTFSRAIDLDDSPHIYSNLGACYRRLNMHDEGIHVLRAALDRDPKYAPTLVNLGSMFVNEGRPQDGIPYLEKAVEIGGEQGAIWNLGLLYLESARFSEGFDLYRQGVNSERASRNFGSKDETIPEPTMLSAELFQQETGRHVA
jgi:tetratricopeptide (TPR) repeat protein